MLHPTVPSTDAEEVRKDNDLGYTVNSQRSKEVNLKHQELIKSVLTYDSLKFINWD